MKTRPILFSAPMVRAILAGHKTQTRRIAKAFLPIPEIDPAPDAVFPTGSHRSWIAWWGQGPFSAAETARLYPGDDGVRCPYGVPGDRLWVKETFVTGGGLAECSPGQYVAGAGAPPAPTIIYRADGAVLPGGCHWKPSIFMPRALSRINLLATEVRAQRLHDITEADARAEGMDWAAPQYLPKCSNGPDEDPREVGYALAGASFARDNYRRLWDQINGPNSWDTNPWVWVVSFEVLR